MNNDIFPCLWYDGEAKESADFYCTVFDGKITADTPVVMNIEIFGQKLMLLNGGPHFTKNASVSFMVICETEAEVQKYWDQLLDGGMALMPLDSYSWSKKYGWVKDKYGVSWQIFLGEKQSEQKEACGARDGGGSMHPRTHLAGERSPLAVRGSGAADFDAGLGARFAWALPGPPFEGRAWPLPLRTFAR